VKYGDIVDGVTMQEALDEVTGLSRKTIIESKDADSRPRVTIKDADGNTVKLPSSDNEGPLLPARRLHVVVTTATTPRPATSVAKIPRETTKTKDITGGLPRVAELFEARKPKDTRSSPRSTASSTSARTPRASARSSSSRHGRGPSEYLIPKGKHLSVRRG